jgi:hypothetical protein
MLITEMYCDKVEKWVVCVEWCVKCRPDRKEQNCKGKPMLSNFNFYGG